MKNISEKKAASAVSIASENSKGSGILITIKEKLYLVTAKHVLYRKKDGDFIFHSNYITVSCPSSVAEDRTTRKYGINLSDRNTRYSKEEDVAVVFLGKCKKRRDTNGWSVILEDFVTKTGDSVNNPLIWSDKWFRTIEKVSVSNDVYIFGFPTSLGIENYTDFFDTDKPILRRGIVSYINTKKRHIVIDCPVYSGNSGGPVFEVTKLANGKSKTSLIGIISRYIPYRQEWFNLRDNYKNIEYVNSGYSVIISIDIILETVNLK